MGTIPRLLTLIVILLFQCHLISAQIFINEIMADNGSTLADPAGDFEDWIELYNGGNSPVDIGGYYITDDPADLTLWQIPADNPSATTIAAGGFLLLWADKDTEDGTLHIDLKLGSGGEDLQLIGPDGSTQIDQVIFGAQNTDISLGRTTDGGVDLQLFTSPTPGSSNEAITAVPTFSGSLETVVQSVNDDAIEYGVSSQGIDLSHYGMVMTESWSDQKVGVRFQDIQITSGATITSAYIQFTCKSPDKSTGDSDLEIRGEKSSNAAPFAEINGNISDRPTTSAKVDWEPEEWQLGEFAGPDEKTPNLASLIQEIVDQNSWDPGNAIAFIIEGSGKRSAHNYTSNYPPTLRVEFEIPTPTDPINNLYINEVAANGTTFQDEKENYSDWVEIYNDNDFAVSLGGLYLTDKSSDLTKWQIGSIQSIPAKGYAMIFADNDPELGGFHANFKLDEDGETLSLVQALNNELIIIDQIDYGNIPFKASGGRSTDAADDWILFGAPTPMAPNENALSWLAAPDISLGHGVYSSSQSVVLSHPDPDADIRYTTDNSDPSTNGQSYSGPITVDETMSLKACAIKSGHAHSKTKTRSYLFDPSATLPVLMITTDPDNLYDDEIGIYTVGTNGIEAGFCSNNQPANFWQDWERPAHLTLFETDGDKAFSVNAGIKISGNCSRRYELKSLNIYLRNNQYGDNNIDYKLFPNRDFKKYDRIRLRNSGQDYRGIMMRDATNQSMLAEVTDVEYQSYRPTIVYINGEYFGIQNFRDLYGGEYFDAFFDVKEKDLDLVKSPRLSNDIKEGDDIHYQTLYNYVLNNDLDDPSNYDYFTTQFDIESFLDYWITMTYMASGDWPANNLQVWRPRTPEGKWRYMYLDTDATTSLYGFNSTNGYQWDTFSEILDPNQQGWPFDSRATLFLRKLLANEAFHDEFIQRTCSFMELILNEERAHSFIDANAAVINDEIGEHVELWAYDNPYLQDYSDWFNKIIRYKEFFTERPDYFYNQMEDHFNLNDQYELSFNYDASTNGDIFVNWKKMSVPYEYTGTYYTGIPLRITAEPKDGYEFLYWLETGDTNATIDFVASGDRTLTPIFSIIANSCNPESPDFMDDDNDGVCDANDQCPGFDDNEDDNQNGIPDGCEPDCPDADNDGVCDADDQCPGFDDNEDDNQNGIPDGCEQPCPDADNDGVCDADDQCPGFDDNEDDNQNGIPDGCEQPCPDADNDGVCDADDQCPGFDDNEDDNQNGIPDGCEQPCPDADNDGVCDADDCEPNNPDLPTAAGTSCDDGNAATENDQILSDGCTCLGTPIVQGDYCEAEGDFPWHEWIENVSFNQINMSSRKRKYTDFTNVVTSIEPGATYDISLTTGYSWETFDEYWNVWIDFNQDFIFDNSEIIFSGIGMRPPNGTETNTITGQVTMPNFVANQSATRMRVAMQRGTNPAPCGIFPFGEVEDYTVILNPSSPESRVSYQYEELKVVPNPARDLVNIQLPKEVKVKSLRILRSNGMELKRLVDIPAPGSSVQLDVQDWQEGIYFIQAEVERGQWRYAKLVVTGTW